MSTKVSSPDLLIFSQFHGHILINQTMLFPTTFISAQEKIGVGLEKHALIFNLMSPVEGWSDIPVLTYFPVQSGRCFQLSGL